MTSRQWPEGHLMPGVADELGPVQFLTSCSRNRENADQIVNIQNGYVLEDVGKPPDLVLEVASPSTGSLGSTR